MNLSLAYPSGDISTFLTRDTDASLEGEANMVEGETTIYPTVTGKTPAAS